VWQVEFTGDALRQFKKLPKPVRRYLKEAVRRQLMESAPGLTTRNKFRLRRASAFADYELRVDDWRIFYRLEDELVLITLVGEKRGSFLIVEGEELRL
jgi:mRNA-degrading endonuclease RelE of RelBE toxin-antitoxin system